MQHERGQKAAWAQQRGKMGFGGLVRKGEEGTVARALKAATVQLPQQQFGSGCSGSIKQKLLAAAAAIGQQGKDAARAGSAKRLGGLRGSGSSSLLDVLPSVGVGLLAVMSRNSVVLAVAPPMASCQNDTTLGHMAARYNCLRLEC